LRKLVDVLTNEQRALGKDYPSHGLLMVNERGRPYTRTPSRHASIASSTLPESLASAFTTFDTRTRPWLGEGVDPKTLSDRTGHANMSVTLQIYTNRSHGRDKAMAQELGDLIQSAVTPDGPS
jgi:integrase